MPFIRFKRANNQKTADSNDVKNADHQSAQKRIAIIGSGVSGLTCAHYLGAQHELTVFEANDYIGGHVNTIDVALQDGKKAKTSAPRGRARSCGVIVSVPAARDVYGPAREVGDAQNSQRGCCFPLERGRSGPHVPS